MHSKFAAWGLAEKQRRERVRRLHGGEKLRGHATGIAKAMSGPRHFALDANWVDFYNARL